MCSLSMLFKTTMQYLKVKGLVKASVSGAAAVIKQFSSHPEFFSYDAWIKALWNEQTT